MKWKKSDLSKGTFIYDDNIEGVGSFRSFARV